MIDLDKLHRENPDNEVSSALCMQTGNSIMIKFLICRNSYEYGLYPRMYSTSQCIVRAQFKENCVPLFMPDKLKKVMFPGSQKFSKKI